MAGAALLLVACSVDVDKLRAPAHQARDAAVDFPVGTGVADADDANVDSGAAALGADAAAGPLDLTTADALGRDEGVDVLSRDGRDDAPALDVMTNPAETRLGAEDSSDSSIGSDALADEADSGEDNDDGNTAADGGGGEELEGGAGADRPSGLDGAIDVTAIGGRGGTGGGGRGGTGAGGSGGTSGSGGTGAGGSGGAGRSGSGGTSSGLAAGLVAYYPCDETAGPTLNDASGNGRNADLVTGTGGSGGYSFNTGHLGNALYLVKAKQGYVSVPQGVLAGATEMTIAAWVYLNAGVDWQRVWDFGSDTQAYMFLTTRATNQKLRFAITDSGYYDEQILDGTAELPIKAWKHVAVVLGNAGALVYVDGQMVASSSAISVRPSDLGATSSNYIGRSRFSDDPYLDGNIDDFRIYRRALSAAEIQALLTYAGP